eukprot:198089_1
MHFIEMNLHHFYVCLNLITSYHAISAQSSVCIWGRQSGNTIINGLYTTAGTYGGKSYYQKDDGCYTLYLFFKASTKDWYINDQLDSDKIAYCTSSTLTDCDDWYVKDGFSFDRDFATNLIPDACPSLSCDKVQIPMLTNGGCNVVFDVHLDDNLWRDSANTVYFYFNSWHFEWQCDNDPPSIDGCSGPWWAYTYPGWTDIPNGQSASLRFQSPYAFHTVNCIMNPTEPPTTSMPTGAPTLEPTLNPTNVLTSAQTKVPTSAPTQEPTSAPTNVPTTTPTKMPTSSPTQKQTFGPTNVPTTTPTKMPTSSPTQKQTFGPTNVPTTTLNPSTSPTVWIPLIVPSRLSEGNARVPTNTALTSRNTPLLTTPNHRKPNNRNQNVMTSYLVPMYVSLGAIPSCFVCMVFMCVYHRKSKKAHESQSKISRLVHNCKPHNEELQVPNMDGGRERVHTVSQYVEDEDDEKELPGPGTIEGDKDLAEIISASVGMTDGNIFIDIAQAEDDKAKYDERNKIQRALLKKWLTETVRLPPVYYDILVGNGYETLDIVKEITKE